MTRNLFLAICVLSVAAGCSSTGEQAATQAFQDLLVPATLENTEWTLTELNGAPVDVGSGQMHPTLILNSADSRVQAFGGINRMSGSYTLEGNVVTFSPMAGTRMAGSPQMMTLESTYARALAGKLEWVVTGRNLELWKDGSIAVRFTMKPN